ncbi:MAG: hypothetical protein M1833_001006 [Piccolia ochrophora]|nr:MAG: hypothetical protein M1833_001006 [Piccolia ochrophora]
MNGNGFRRPPYASPPTQAHDGAVQPTSEGAGVGLGLDGYPLPPKVILDGYKGSLNRQYEERTRYNPLNRSRPQSSALLNANDPVAMHLLVETALGDSSEYEVLSYEEVDELKKEHKHLSQRIEMCNKKLLQESKVRDAAKSMSRLYSKKGRSQTPDGSPSSHRRSLFGSLSGNNDLTKQMDEELAMSNRKCEEAAQELWIFEKRAGVIERRLLHHNAGVLQMTYRAGRKGQGGQGGQGLPLQMPPPGSPDSMDMFTTWRESVPTVAEDDFDDRSQYRTVDRLDKRAGASESRSRPGSPRRPSSRRSVSGQQAQVIAFSERKLEDLNHRFQDLVAQANPDHAHDPLPQNQLNGAPPQIGTNVQNQLEYLEKSLGAMERYQGSVMRSAKQTEYAMEERVEGLNKRLHELVLAANPEQSQSRRTPPELSGQSLPGQLDYLQNGLGDLQQSIRLLSGNGDLQDKIQHFETVLMGLWDIMLAGEEESRQQEKRRRQASSPTQYDADDSQDDFIPNEEFSIQGFSAKVQSLYAKATSLREQKGILQRQVQQQRELNDKSDSAKDADLTRLTGELDQTKASLDVADRESKHAKAQLEELVAVIGQRQEQLLKLEATLEETKHHHNASQAELQSHLDKQSTHLHSLEAELDTALNEKAAATATHAGLQSDLDAKTAETQTLQSELSSLESEVVRLQTDVTVARAELDGAYGTRAQRAAETAQNPEMQQQIDELSTRKTDLQRRVDVLQKELAETIDEYEVLTKQSIEFEKEREGLEKSIDDLRERCERAELDLSDERVRWMGVKSPGGPATGPAESTSSAVLRSEFRKMMRDARSEASKTLRAEQEERRRLEALVRSLKKDKEQHTQQHTSASSSSSSSQPPPPPPLQQQHGSGKSGLSQSVSASS